MHVTRLDAPLSAGYAGGYSSWPHAQLGPLDLLTSDVAVVDLAWTLRFTSMQN